MDRSMLLTTAAATLLIVAGPDSPRAAEVQPAKPDTPAQLQPGEITFSTSIVPGGARPGETVTYRAMARLEEPWHVYAYHKAQPVGPGPVRTRFDFFDHAGLELVDDWTPSKEPDRKQEHQGEVTWSIRLKVADDARPGRTPLRCQAYFMICDPMRCKPPARSTLPTATLTVLPADPAR